MVFTHYPPVLEGQYQRLLLMIKWAEWLGLQVDERSLVAPELKNSSTCEQILSATANVYARVLEKYQQLELNKRVSEDESDISFMRSLTSDEGLRVIPQQYDEGDCYPAAKVRMDFDFGLILSGANSDPLAAINRFYER